MGMGGYQWPSGQQVDEHGPPTAMTSTEGAPHLHKDKLGRHPWEWWAPHSCDDNLQGTHGDEDDQAGTT